MIALGSIKEEEEKSQREENKFNVVGENRVITTMEGSPFKMDSEGNVNQPSPMSRSIDSSKQVTSILIDAPNIPESARKRSAHDSSSVASGFEFAPNQEG